MSGIELGNNEELEKETIEPLVTEFPGVFKDMVTKIECCEAIIIDVIFDERMAMTRLGSTAIVSFDKELPFDKTHPALTISTMDDLLTYLIVYIEDVMSKVIITKDLKDIPFEYEHIYENKEVAEKAKNTPKIIVTFKDKMIDKVIAYMFENEFVFTKTLISCKNIVDGKKQEMLMNTLMNNFMMVLGGLNQRKTPGGIITP